MSDVNEAKKIISEKVQNFIGLTDEETEVLERGTITINTLNRIENKQDEIKTALNDMGYFNTPIVNKTWQYNDVFDENNFKRIVDNNMILREAFYALSDSPQNAIIKYHYSEINALEKILFDVSKNMDYTINEYRRCGNFNCGG